MAHFVLMCWWNALEVAGTETREVVRRNIARFFEEHPELTQAQVEQSLGLTRGYISKVLHGRRNPTMALVDRFCARYGLERGYFLGDDDVPSKVSELRREVEEIWMSGELDEEYAAALLTLIRARRARAKKDV